MPMFEIEGPDGAIYELDAPDERAAVAAFRKFSGGPKPLPSDNGPWTKYRQAENRSASGIIEVEGPDGTIVEFPAGTSHEVMRSAMARHYGGPGTTGATASRPDQMTAFFANELAPALTPQSLSREAADLVGTGGRFVAPAARFADDAVRKLADAVTFGYADPIAAAIGGASVEDERAKTEAASDRLGPWVSSGLDIAGGLAPFGLLGKGVALAGKAAGGLPLAGKVASNPLAQALVSGAVGGALDASGHGRNVMQGAAFGAAGGAGGHLVGKAVGAAASKVGGMIGKPTIPTRESIESAKQAAYATAERSGTMYSSQVPYRLRQRVIAALTDLGYDPALQPGAAAVARRLADLQGNNVTLTGLDTLRKVASNGYIPGNKSNNLAVAKIIEAIDDVLYNPAKGDIVGGNARAGVSALKEGRELARRGFKLDDVDDALSRADLRAASTGSGGNVDNATRQNLRRLLERPRGFTPDERQALETVVRGTPTQNALRLVGKLSPTSGGLMGMLGTLGAGGMLAQAVHPSAAIPMVAGMLAKPAADRMTARNVDALRDIIAAGGSRAATQSAAQRAIEARRDALARALSAAGAVTTGRLPAIIGGY